MPLQRYRGMFEPDDLELIQRVFDQLCSERALKLSDQERREALAWEVVITFQNGAADEADLLRRIRNR